MTNFILYGYRSDSTRPIRTTINSFDTLAAAEVAATNVIRSDEYQRAEVADEKTGAILNTLTKMEKEG